MAARSFFGSPAGRSRRIFKGSDAVTPGDFRRIALALPEAVEAAHMQHPDFRVGGKIFATLGYPGEGWGAVRLTPAQQERLVDTDADVFVPAAGAWGRTGMTTVRLADAPAGTV